MNFIQSLTITNIKDFFTKGNSRTVKAKKQILYSFFLKAISVVIGLMFVPLLLNYLDAERYGIWLTLTSIVGWFRASVYFKDIVYRSIVINNIKTNGII